MIYRDGNDILEEFGEGIRFRMCKADGTPVPTRIEPIAIDFIRQAHRMAGSTDAEVFRAVAAPIEEVARKKFVACNFDAAGGIRVTADDVKAAWPEMPM